MNKKNIIVALVFCISLILTFVTRFYKLGLAPKGLYLDEAGQGYSAYSILKTGKDEFGKSFPIVFRSFTDFKTPIYVYLIVPLIPLFELTAFTVRFPSFFFSILTIPILFLLLKKVAPEKYKYTIPSLTVLLLSISPWHILFGRTNFECNVALFFLLGGIYVFYLSITRPKLIVLSALLFAVAIPAYHAQRIVTPLMMLALFLRHRKVILLPSHKKYFIVGAILGFLLLLPTLSVATTPGFLARAAGLNIFSQNRQNPAGFMEQVGKPFSYFVNSRVVLSSIEFLSLYTSYFSPRNMFILGDYGPRSSFPQLSTFFLWQMPFYVYGFYFIVKNKNLGELKFLTLSLLFVSPLPAAVTRDPYSTIRSLQMVIPLLIIVSFGLIAAWEKLKNKYFKAVSIFIFILLILFSLAKLYSSVMILNEYYRARYWNYGWEQAVNALNKTKQNLPVIIDNSRDEGYIQLAFFLKFDPASYQKDNFEVPVSQYYTDMNRNKEKHIGRIVTRPINWEKDLLVEQYLVGDELAISLQQIAEHKLTLVDEIKYPDQSVALRIVKTNPYFIPVKR